MSIDGLILLFFNDNCIDYALIQKSKILDFKFPTPDQNNQITQNDKKLFDISNKFFKICELLDEYEIMPIHSDAEIENFGHLHLEYRYGYRFVAHDRLSRKNVLWGLKGVLLN